MIVCPADTKRFLLQIKSACDSSNFDSYPPNRDGDPPDDFTGWDEDF